MLWQVLTTAVMLSKVHLTAVKRQLPLIIPLLPNGVHCSAIPKMQQYAI